MNIYGLPSNLPLTKNQLADIASAREEDAPVTYIVKRPGFSDSQTTATAAGRALYAWPDGDAIYAVVGNKIYKDGSRYLSIDN